MTPKEKAALLRPEYRVNLQNKAIPLSVRAKNKSIDYTAMQHKTYETNDDYGYAGSEHHTPHKDIYYPNIDIIHEE